MRRLFAVLIMVFFLAVNASFTLAEVIGPGEADYEGYALLSDFQQSYGQVVGNDVTFGSDSTVEGLKFWGLYYNYNDYTNNPPENDAFTIRFHNMDGNDPVEDYFFQASLGHASRTDTGEDLDELGLIIYEYSFDNLDISVLSGHYLLSIINDTTDPTVDGYWHWVSASDTGSSWWRREDSQPTGQESTVNWTLDDHDMAYSLEANPVPVPAAVWLLGSGLLGLAGLRRKLRK